MPTTADRSSTAAQLRRDIDRGHTGDKVAWPDPALAPLGTDEEAAGTPLAPGDIAAARRAERRGLVQPQPDSSVGDAWILIGFILALLAGVLGWLVAAA